jgi:SAM-dependent methyltransferase
LIEIRHVEDANLTEAYDAYYARQTTAHDRDYYRWLVKLLRPQPGRRLLDVACGQGPLLHAAAERGLAACGVDLSRQALTRSDALPVGAAFVLGSGECLPFADGCFAYVTSIGSLEHYGDPERGAAELARVLAPEGRAVVLLPNTFGLLWTVRDARHTGEVCDDGQPIQRYGTRKEWERLLERGGFRMERVVGFDIPVRPRSLRGWFRFLVHPIDLARAVLIWLFMPVNLAGCLVYICGRARERAAASEPAPGDRAS